VIESDLKQITNRLKDFGSRTATPEARKEIMTALESKWEGVQAVAAKVLAIWGGRESVDALRAWLIQCQQRKNGWAVRSVAVKALSECIDECDVDWILDMYFSVSGVLAKHELLYPLVVNLPPKAARKRLMLECKSTDRDNRQAAMKAIANMRNKFRNREAILEQFTQDPDPQIRYGASMNLKKLMIQ
jgi:HEAT repeat protein